MEHRRGAGFGPEELGVAVLLVTFVLVVAVGVMMVGQDDGRSTPPPLTPAWTLPPDPTPTPPTPIPSPIPTPSPTPPTPLPSPTPTPAMPTPSPTPSPTSSPPPMTPIPLP
jgi:hypothetical protein